MVAGYISKNGKPEQGTVFCPMIDARRLEVYAALYNHEMAELKAPKPWIIDADDFLAGTDAAQQIICFGNGAMKAIPHLLQHNIQFDGENYISALNLVQLGLRYFDLKQFIDIAYFEPDYLKTMAVAHISK